MILSEAFALIEKNLCDANGELGFAKTSSDEKSVTFAGEKGVYRLVHDAQTNILQFECAYENNGDSTEFKTISKSLFDLEVVNERDAKSVANEVVDEINSLFAKKKKVDLDKVKMPKAVSRAKAKSGSMSYDTNSLANKFGVLYPETKDEIKRNIAEYGEFLPETFFMEFGTPIVLDVIKNGTDAQRDKLFKMLNEIYEDGTNEVQDIIGVTILGEMKNDAQMMEVAKKYMSDYMSGPVCEINKITAKKNKYTKKLANPPAYKPKKQRGMMQSALAQQQQMNK